MRKRERERGREKQGDRLKRQNTFETCFLGHLVPNRFYVLLMPHMDAFLICVLDEVYVTKAVNLFRLKIRIYVVILKNRNGTLHLMKITYCCIRVFLIHLNLLYKTIVAKRGSRPKLCRMLQKDYVFL